FRGRVSDLAARYRGPAPVSDATDLRARAAAAAAEIWRAEIERTAASLSTAFTAVGPTDERMQAVLDLRNDSFYRRVGTAFWIELVQRAGVDLSRVMFLSLELRADG